jgi:hypothetical protein
LPVTLPYFLFCVAHHSQLDGFFLRFLLYQLISLPERRFKEKSTRAASKPAALIEFLLFEQAPLLTYGLESPQVVQDSLFVGVRQPVELGDHLVGF